MEATNPTIKDAMRQIAKKIKIFRWMGIGLLVGGSFTLSNALHDEPYDLPSIVNGLFFIGVGAYSILNTQKFMPRKSTRTYRRRVRTGMGIYFLLVFLLIGLKMGDLLPDELSDWIYTFSMIGLWVILLSYNWGWSRNWNRKSGF